MLWHIFRGRNLGICNHARDKKIAVHGKAGFLN
jgi:hypothetical protein